MKQLIQKQKFQLIRNIKLNRVMKMLKILKLQQMKTAKIVLILMKTKITINLKKHQKKN